MPSSEANVSIDLRRQIGAVVIGRNEGERLIACLEKLKASLDHVVYADSGSSDGSVEAARALGVSVVVLTPDKPFTAARGRREGLEQLIAEAPPCTLVQFLDGDCILQDGWLDGAAAFILANPDVAAVCGRRFEAHPEASFYNRMIDREWDTPVGQAAACGGDSLMRIAAVTAVGSFRPDLLAGEEPELCTRLRAAGWKIFRLGVPMTEHDARIMAFGTWWRRAQRGGAGYAQGWSVTRRTGAALYGRQIASAFLWVALIPVAALIMALAFGKWPILLLAPGMWALQILRMAVRETGDPFSFRLRKAAVTMATKVAELIGAARFFFAGGQGQATSYRAAEAASAVAHRES